MNPDFVPVENRIVATVPVLDQTATDAVVETLRKLGYDQITLENVTRISATKPLLNDGTK
jgi:hypothetical protein